MTSLNRSLRYLRMPSYDATDCDPPAPVAQVTLRNVHSGEMVADVPLLLDTGADVTLLPRNTVEQLGVQLVAGQRYELMGFNGSTSSAPVVMLDLLFLKRAFRGRYLVIEEGRGIMGCWMVRNNSGRNIHAVDPQRRDRHQGVYANLRPVVLGCLRPVQIRARGNPRMELGLEPHTVRAPSIAGFIKQLLGPVRIIAIVCLELVRPLIIGDVRGRWNPTVSPPRIPRGVMSPSPSKRALLSVSRSIANCIALRTRTSSKGAWGLRTEASSDCTARVPPAAAARAPLGAVRSWIRRQRSIARNVRPGVRGQLSGIVPASAGPCGPLGGVGAYPAGQ